MVHAKCLTVSLMYLHYFYALNLYFHIPNTPFYAIRDTMAPGSFSSLICKSVYSCLPLPYIHMIIEDCKEELKIVRSLSL